MEFYNFCLSLRRYVWLSRHYHDDDRGHFAGCFEISHSFGASLGAVLRLNRRTAIQGLRRESDSNGPQGGIALWGFLVSTPCLRLETRAPARSFIYQKCQKLSLRVKTHYKPLARCKTRPVTSTHVFQQNALKSILERFNTIRCIGREAFFTIGADQTAIAYSPKQSLWTKHASYYSHQIRRCLCFIPAHDSLAVNAIISTVQPYSIQNQIGKSIPIFTKEHSL